MTPALIKPNFNASEKLSSQIADAIEQKIRRSEIPVGQKLPPEKELSKTFNVCLVTLRKALSKLEAEGYIERRPSRGTIVINSSPAAMDLKRKNAIGVILCAITESDISDLPPFNGILKGIEQETKRREISLLLKVIREDEKEPSFFGNEKNMMGLLVSGRMTFNHLKIIRKLGLPYILIGDLNYNEKKTEENTDVVTDDEFQVFYAATKRLVDSGHRRIAIMHSARDNAWWHAEKLRGYRQALMDFGIGCLEELEIPSQDMSYEHGYSAAGEFLKKGVAFTALVCSGSRQCQGAVNAFREKGLGVPGDVSVICKSDKKLPDMATIFCDEEEVGRKGVERLVYKLTNPGTWKPERVYIDPEIVNESVSVRRIAGEIK